jgi:hypothetical protein
MRRLFADRGFEVLDIRWARNAVSLRYLAHLLPIPSDARARLVERLRRISIGRISLWLPLGNLVLIARRPFVGTTT